MRLQALSLGCEVEVWAARRGAVHSVFAGAINLLIEDEMWTVLDSAKPDSPFGIRLAPGMRSDATGLRRADRVQVRGGFIGVGDGLVLDCRSASRWAPVRWRQPAAGFEGRLAAAEQAALPRAWPGSAGMASDVAQALHSVGAGSDTRLARAVNRIVGRGPGLTPAGDDVLVGIMAMLGCAAAGQAGASAMARLANALAPALPSTSDLSRHLLGQAARALPGRALHDLGRALVEGAAEATLDRALEAVLDTGATSGADACIGLVAASRMTLLAAERLAA